MPDESNDIPPARLAGWLALGVLILFAVALYFHGERRIASLGGAPAAADTLPTR
ncbi:MAG: hypothetical protein HYS40_04440 [Gemmatimonadetes bacterium]|nr:hypothetical protein [Gemmatimonadota bacterium]